MPQYTVSEVAARTGFSPSTLRYYDKVGLVTPTARSGAGYRLYDEGAVVRLAFVTRAKRLGLDLDHIGDLLELFDGGECAPVQARLGDVVAAKLAEVEQRIAELHTLSAELTALESRLGRAAHPGPCDDDCACLTTGTPVASAPAPVACDLRDATDTPAERTEAYRRLFADAYVGRDRTAAGIRFRFRADRGVEARVRDLAARETQCCGFFTFAITVVGGEVLLDTTVTNDNTARAVLDELFDLPHTVQDGAPPLRERLTARGLRFVGAASTT